MMTYPTVHPKVNRLLDELLRRVQTVLSDQFVGLYLFGSLTSGDFDPDSDIDVLVVTEDDLSAALFAGLKAMHQHIVTGGSHWATQLEVSYIPLAALRRHEPTHADHPHIDRGCGDQELVRMRHDASWIVQRHVLRERGITVAGPAPATLIDDVTADDLRRAMVDVLNGWAAPILAEPAQMQARGYQSYMVLSLCRILYTLRHGTVASKRAAARWAQGALPLQWGPLIARTWVGRRHPGLAASPADVDGTLAFIQYALEQGA